MKTIIITPEGTASLQPLIDAARSRLRPPMIAPDVIVCKAHRDWMARNDAAFEDNLDALRVICRAVRSSLGLHDAR